MSKAATRASRRRPPQPKLAPVEKPAAAPAPPNSAKPMVFAILSAGVLITTIQWASHIASTPPDNPIHILLIFKHLFIKYDAPSAIHIGIAFVVALAAAFVVPAAWFDRLARWIAENPVLFGLLSFIMLAVGAYVAYDNYPLALDEYAQYFQAQIFAHGKLYGQYPPNLVRGLLPLPGQFIEFSGQTGRTMSGYWPGFPLLLAPFMFLRIPWVVNPLIGVVGILLMRHLALKLMPETPQAAGWAMLFMLASPAFSINAISYYTMNVYLTLGLAYAALLLELTPKRLFAAGVVGSFALVQHNPFPHAVFALPWLLWLALRRDRVRNLFWIGLGYLPLTLLLFYGWWALKAHVLSDAYVAAAAKTGGSVSLLKNLSRVGAFALPTPHILTERTLATLKLYLWAVPGLAIIWVWGFWRLRAQPVARLLVWSAVITYASYFLVIFDQGHGWGYRYFHPAWGILPLFSAAWVTEKREGFKWAPMMGALAVISLVVLTPIRMVNVHEFIKQSEAQAPPRDPDKRQVSFVNVYFGQGRYYSQDAVRNDPFLRNPSIVLRSFGLRQDTEFMRRNYPNATRVFEGIHGSVWDLND